jgi:hypothetical protein
MTMPMVVNVDVLVSAAIFWVTEGRAATTSAARHSAV